MGMSGKMEVTVPIARGISMGIPPTMDGLWWKTMESPIKVDDLGVQETPYRAIFCGEIPFIQF